LRDTAVDLAPVAIFGGTFDPIHHGHLRCALELAEQLQLGQVHLMPCAVPPHRESPAGSALHRAAMLELAVCGESLVTCDRRELGRQGPSYTVDSLIELRRELGEGRSIILIMGCDALLAINEWHRWQELLDWAHVVVLARPGWQLPAHGPIKQWLQANRCGGPEGLRQRSAGSVLIQELRLLPISASEIRSIVAAGLSARFLLPESVLAYIGDHNLYLKSHMSNNARGTHEQTNR
jgi:nicotinate-nucleotide adenylyltransferase